MAKLVIYRIGPAVPRDVAGPIYNRTPGSQGIIASQNLFELPKSGQRASVQEYKADEQQITHSRLGPWMVESVEEYPGGGSYESMVLCTCSYSPIPELENPWVPVKRLSGKEAIAA